MWLGYITILSLSRHINYLFVFEIETPEFNRSIVVVLLFSLTAPHILHSMNIRQSFDLNFEANNTVAVRV